MSNYGIKHLNELLQNGRCKTKPAVNQIELSPFLQRIDLCGFCEAHGIAIEAWSPLTRGKRLQEPALLNMASKYNISSAQLLIKWCLQKGFITIPKSSKKERIIENASVFHFEIHYQRRTCVLWMPWKKME